MKEASTLASEEKKEMKLPMRPALPVWADLLITAACMGLLIFIVYQFKIPNPNMILIAGLVICSALLGYPGGILAGLIMLGYTLYFFSEGNDFVTFGPQNTQKVIVSLVGIVVDLIFVCELKRRRDAAFREIRALTEALSEDNRRLQEASEVDGLTKIHNRLALRLRYPGYKDKDVHVMMLDIDDFKQINDLHGHGAGDRALEETGRCLAETFGRSHCYRYGGDEFLVIAPGLSDAEFEDKLRSVTAEPLELPVKDGKIDIVYSYGYVQGKADAGYPLRDMISQADERMYAHKHEKGTGR